MNVHGLPVLDLRHLLPNLNNLLLTLSSPVAVSPEQGEAASTDSVLGNGGPAGSSTSNGPEGSVAGASSSSFSSAPASSVDSPTRKRRAGYKMAGKGEIVLPSTPRSAVMDGEGSVEHGETAKEENAGVNGGRHDGSATSSISAPRMRLTPSTACKACRESSMVPPAAAAVRSCRSLTQVKG